MVNSTITNSDIAVRINIIIDIVICMFGGSNRSRVVNPAAMIIAIKIMINICLFGFMNNSGV